MLLVLSWSRNIYLAESALGTSTKYNDFFPALLNLILMPGATLALLTSTQTAKKSMRPLLQICFVCDLRKNWPTIFRQDCLFWEHIVCLKAMFSINMAFKQFNCETERFSFNTKCLFFFFVCVVFLKVSIKNFDSLTVATCVASLVNQLWPSWSFA